MEASTPYYFQDGSKVHGSEFSASRRIRMGGTVDKFVFNGDNR
jgi:hypothetical protein